MVSRMKSAWSLTPPQKTPPLDSAAILARGRAAEALLKNDTLNAVFSELEVALWQKFRSSKPNDSEARDKVWLSFNLLDEVSKRLHTYVTEAEMQRRAEEQRAKSGKAKGSYFE